MYKYFIAYNYVDRKGFGFGNCECKTDRKIEDFEHIEDIIEKIKKQKRFKGIVVLNYKLLREEK